MANFFTVFTVQRFVTIMQDYPQIKAILLIDEKICEMNASIDVMLGWTRPESTP